MCLTKEHNYYNYSISLISSSEIDVVADTSDMNILCLLLFGSGGPDLHSVCFSGDEDFTLLVH